MTELLATLSEYLTSSQLGFGVKYGSMPNPAEQPVKLRTLYLSAEGIEDGRLSIAVSVFVPAGESGQACVYGAEGIAALLKDSGCPVKIDGIRIGAAEYNRSCMAFVCVIRGTIDNSESKRYYFRAESFENDPSKIVSCGISSYRIKRIFGNYPVMTVFRDVPAALAEFESVYEITLPEVPVLFIEELTGFGRFKLTVGGEEFFDCFCTESVNDETRRCTVTVRGYKAVEPEPSPIPVQPDN